MEHPMAAFKHAIIASAVAAFLAPGAALAQGSGTAGGKSAQEQASGNQAGTSQGGGGSSGQQAGQAGSPASGSAGNTGGTSGTSGGSNTSGTSGSSAASSGPAQGAASQGTADKAGGNATAGRAKVDYVIVPVVSPESKSWRQKGCWAKFYDDRNFTGDQLTLVGPVDMADMTGPFGIDWKGKISSVETGPKARVLVYDNENFNDLVATFKPGQRAAEVSKKMGFFDEFTSMKIACDNLKQGTGGQKAGSS